MAFFFFFSLSEVSFIFKKLSWAHWSLSNSDRCSCLLTSWYSKNEGREQKIKHCSFLKFQGLSEMESIHAHRQVLWENVWKKIKDSHAVVDRHLGYEESWKKIKEMWSVIGWSQNEKPDVEVPSVKVSIESAPSHRQPLEDIHYPHLGAKYSVMQNSKAWLWDTKYQLCQRSNICSLSIGREDYPR